MTTLIDTTENLVSMLRAAYEQARGDAAELAAAIHAAGVPPLGVARDAGRGIRDALTQLLSRPRPGEAPLPEAQVWRARALARAHSHYWAGQVETDRSPSIEGIRRASVESERLDDHGGIAGIRAPTFDGGDVVHETLSGRTTWRIAPDGATRVEIRRPETGACIVLEIDGTEMYTDARILTATQAVRLRHVEAALVVLGAVHGIPDARRHALRTELAAAAAAEA